MRWLLMLLVACSGSGSSSTPVGYCFLNSWERRGEECETTVTECRQRSHLVWHGDGVPCYPIATAWQLDAAGISYVVRSELDCDELVTRVTAEGYAVGSCRRLGE